jgi:uncharacterized protein
MPLSSSPLSFKSQAIPASTGVGFKPEHGEDIFGTLPQIGWFEIHPENYMQEGGAALKILERLRQEYPLSLHGVGLSIGGSGALDTEHLQRLAVLEQRFQPGLFSEHLAWSSHEEACLNDLLPLPYTKETLAYVGAHVAQVQDTLKRQILIENPSTYVRFSQEEMSETAFLTALAQQTGCGLLLDVNNIHVSAANHGYDPSEYIEEFPVTFVREIHLAGHAPVTLANGETLLIDAHDRSIVEDVWTLFEQVLTRTGSLPVLVEWDNDVPAWPVLYEEAQKADRRMSQSFKHAA